MNNLRIKLKTKLAELNLLFCSTTFGYNILCLYDSILYFFASEDKKQELEMQDAKDRLICESISKIFILMEALSESGNNDISILKSRVLWDVNVNKVEPNIAQILEIENSDELILKLSDIANSLADLL